MTDSDYTPDTADVAMADSLNADAIDALRHLQRGLQDDFAGHLGTNDSLMELILDQAQRYVARKIPFTNEAASEELAPDAGS